MPLRSTRFGVFVGTAAVLCGLGVAQARTKQHKPPLCAGGRFIVEAGPLLPGAPASEVDVVEVGGVPVTASISVGCGAANLKGRVSFRATKKGTQVAARWTKCGPLKGLVKLTKGLITDSCSTMTGVLRGKGFKHPFHAVLSACGDGFLDTDTGEQCDPGGVPCATLGDVCTAQCMCVPPLVRRPTTTTIHCQSPADASMLTVATGSALTFRGQAIDPAGIAAVAVNGAPVAVGADGSFSAPITSAFGINFVDVVATNTAGEVSASTCTFLAADTFAAEADFLDDDVSLRLGQPAIDDASQAGPIASFGDVLNVVLNDTSGLTSTIDGGLNGINPLKPLSCDNEVCPLGHCVCLLSSGIDYVSGSFSVVGPNTAALTLLEEQSSQGLRATATIGALSFALRAHGQVAGIPYDITGGVALNQLMSGMSFDVSASSGLPSVSVLPGSVSVTVGSVSLSFPGLVGDVVNLISPLVQGTLKTRISQELQETIPYAFQSSLDSLISHLMLPTGTVDVPRIGEPGAVTLDLTGELSSLDVNAQTQGALFGLGTRITVAPGQTITSLGIALPQGALLRDAGGGAPIAVSVHTGTINQVLHALWRGGLFHTTIAAGSLPGVPPGMVAQIATLLPPVVTAGPGNEVDLRVGAVHVMLTVPGVFDTPVSFVAGGEGSATVAVAGDTLELTNATIDGLHIGAVDTSLDGAQLAAIEGIVRVLLGRLLDSALGGAGVAVIIPAFPIPAELVNLGLPAGEFGLVGPTVASVPPYFDLSGSFGIR